MSASNLNLCGNCWRISHPNGWWAFNIEEGVPEDTNDDLAFYRCPQCGFDHRDADDDPGVWDAPKEKLERIRLEEQPDFRHVRELLAGLRDQVRKLYETDVLDFDTHLPMDVRDELIRLGCSTIDYLFHVYRQRQNDDLTDDPMSWMYRALEVESGGGAWGVTAREAVDNYFRDDVLEHINRLPENSAERDGQTGETELPIPPGYEPESRARRGGKARRG